MPLNTSAYEVNFDGLVGPTHNYAGLAHGNLASEKNKGKKSNPKKAALEGLAKMKFLADLGVKQAVLPPHERPHLPSLRALAFTEHTVCKGGSPSRTTTAPSRRSGRSRAA